MAKQRHVRRQSVNPQNLHTLEFLNAKVIVTRRDGVIFADLRTMCLGLRLSPSSQMTRLLSHKKDVVHVAYSGGKAAKLMTLETTQWWLDTLSIEMINTYAGRLVAEYRKSLVPAIKSFFEEKYPEQSTTPAPFLAVKTSPDRDSLVIYQRMEKNKTLRDEALASLRAAEDDVKKYQDLINKDMASVVERMLPKSKTEGLRLDLLEGEFDVPSYEDSL